MVTDLNRGEPAFSRRTNRPTALEVSKWVEATPETNADRTVVSVGTFEPSLIRALTSVPAQNHLPVAVRWRIRMEGGEGGWAHPAKW